jgi:hypothetical protein
MDEMALDFSELTIVSAGTAYAFTCPCKHTGELGLRISTYRNGATSSGFTGIRARSLQYVGWRFSITPHRPFWQQIVNGGSTFS